jgi:hypothetical protein
MSGSIVYLGEVSSTGFTPNLSGQCLRWQMRKKAGGDFVISLTDEHGVQLDLPNTVYDLVYDFQVQDKRLFVLEDNSSGKRV